MSVSVIPAGGHVCVLSELLAAGACHWACQLPGASLTSSALDLAALGGHMEVGVSVMCSLLTIQQHVCTCLQLGFVVCVCLCLAITCI